MSENHRTEPLTATQPAFGMRLTVSCPDSYELLHRTMSPGTCNCHGASR